MIFELKLDEICVSDPLFFVVCSCLLLYFYQEHGWTALMFAVRFGKLEVVKILIAAGADIEAINKVVRLLLCFPLSFHPCPVVIR